MTTITDADKEAAASFLESWEPGPEMTVVKLARAFANHREAEVPKEVAKIVAWLREIAAWHEKNDDGWSGFDKIRQGLVEAADAIEAGEYRNDA